MVDESPRRHIEGKGRRRRHGEHHVHVDLAQAFQSYYIDHQFLVDDGDLRDGRLALALATRQVLANGLDVLGVQAPEAM